MFEDRRNRLEKEIDLDTQKKFKVSTIRNKNLGKWAAEKQGLDLSKYETYIDEVIMADFKEPGYEDVIKKIATDFEKVNINITYDEIKEKLLSFEKEALSNLSN